jgi:phage terminase Nu1 subunit (DNA packaging protein)
MSAPITETHRALAEKLGDLLDVEQMTGPSPAEQAAQLIADSEAQAVVAAHAVTAVYAERDQLRAEVERLDAEKPWLKEANATNADLRAEVERLKKQAVFDGDHIHALNAAFATRAEVTDANARAERAEAALRNYIRQRVANHPSVGITLR